MAILFKRKAKESAAETSCGESKIIASYDNGKLEKTIISHEDPGKGRTIEYTTGENSLNIHYDGEGSINSLEFVTFVPAYKQRNICLDRDPPDLSIIVTGARHNDRYSMSKRDIEETIDEINSFIASIRKEHPKLIAEEEKKIAELKEKVMKGL